MGKSTKSPPLNYARIVANKDASLGEMNEISINEPVIFATKNHFHSIVKTIHFRSIVSIAGGAINGTPKSTAETLTSIVLFLNSLKNYKTRFQE